MMKQKMEEIIIKNLSKKFRIGFKKEQSVLSYFISFFSGIEPKKEFWALKGISFSVNSRENIGIIGKNGSGKTVLLKTIMGIYNLDKGEIKTNGNIVILSGVGLRSRLTLMDNIYLVSSILGLSQKDIKRKFNSIVEFAGLQDFVNTKIYQFSSGMRKRIAFSIIIHYIEHYKPDILLLDEIFAGGDEEFKNKSLKKLEELMGKGTTFILVGHNLKLIEKYCDRVIWLDKGKIIKDGKPKEVIEAYVKFIKRG
ncbi:hypothetical protein CEE44_03180 [Candidatus Woesearchaeota archaeon B3_Woes]|nr:MAG: hypothetical protein CEE44_03180 [Candidatus Woesearchaeota archaeon B3_Woes]